MKIWSDKTVNNAQNLSSGEQYAPAAKLRPSVARDIRELEQMIVDRFGPLHSALSSGTKVEGRLTFDKPIKIDGELKGEIVAPQAIVVIGPEGKVEANIEAALLVILGNVRGAIKAVNRVELLSGGAVCGDIDAPRLVMEENSIFNGRCSMNSDNFTQDEKKSYPPKAERSSPERRAGDREWNADDDKSSVEAVEGKTVLDFGRVN